MQEQTQHAVTWNSPFFIFYFVKFTKFVILWNLFMYWDGNKAVIIQMITSILWFYFYRVFHQGHQLQVLNFNFMKIFQQSDIFTLQLINNIWQKYSVSNKTCCVKIVRVVLRPKAKLFNFCEINKNDIKHMIVVVL